MTSIARLNEKMNRLGVSIGSQTSAAPVSPEAQPPTSAAASAAAATDRRALTAIDFDTLAIIDANPVWPPGPENAGPIMKSSLAQGACTLKLIAGGTLG